MSDKNQTAIKFAPKKASEDSTAFKIFHASSASGGAMMIAAILSSYFSVYMTDTMMIPAASASLIMFIATLWDAINDPIMGVLADKTRTKFGRYRPYFLAAPLLLTFFAVMLWVNPNLSSTGKFVYVLVMYIGYGMTVTMYTMPQTAVLPASVKSDDKRNSILSLGAGFSALAFTIGSSYAGSIKTFFENTLHVSNGYIPLMICCGVLACVSFWGLFATSDERYVNHVEQQPGLRSLVSVLKHKELAPFIVVWVLAALGYGLNFSSTVYYLTYYMKRPDLISTYFLIGSIGGLGSMFVLLPLLLKIFKSGHKALIFTQAISIVGYVILFFTGKLNPYYLIFASSFVSFFSTMENALVNVLVNDAIDYIQLKDGIAANGVISSIKGFAQKCGNTVVSSGILAVLSISGYVAGDIENQPASAMFALNFIRFGAPAVIGILIIFFLRFNPCEKHKDEIAAMKAKME
jgi:Na+/melibiose symporter-like transporter